MNMTISYLHSRHHRGPCPPHEGSTARRQLGVDVARAGVDVAAMETGTEHADGPHAGKGRELVNITTVTMVYKLPI